MIGYAFFMLHLSGFLSLTLSAEDKKPNILMIAIDDQKIGSATSAGIRW